MATKDPFKSFDRMLTNTLIIFIFSHFIPTNQPYADRVNKIIEKQITITDKIPDTIAVFNVVAIKEVYDEMHKRNIRGKTKQSICNLLRQFNLNVKDKTLMIEYDIENTLKYITELDDRRRIFCHMINLTRVIASDSTLL